MNTLSCGPGAFYKGIGPAWLREGAEKSMRLGLYDPIKLIVGAVADASPLRKFAAGAIAGAIGALVGNPFDLIKVRMIANKNGKGEGAGEIITDIYKNQGIFGFYTGFQTSVIKAMIKNAT